MPENSNGRQYITPVAALKQHLDRASRGEGRFYPLPDGEKNFACDMGESIYGCPWCDNFAWPDGNPLDLEPLDDETEVL